MMEPKRFPIVSPRKDPMRKMHAVEWHGRKDVRIVERSRPLLTEAGDALVRITLSTICGSDLHLYNNEFSGMEKGDVLGHEAVGVVEEVGPEVTNVSPGDKVVVSAIIACGKCEYCQKELFSCCDNTNPSMEMEKLYGHRTAGIFGYSHLTGGYDGCQAEYIRVPIANVNLLKVDPDLPDEKLIFLSDVACTAWHACEMGEVREGQVVAVWGAGPVGQMVMKFCKLRGAKTVFAIDPIPYRVDMARKYSGAEPIYVNEDTNVVKSLFQLCPGGPDVCIDAAGFRFPMSLLHKFQRVLRMETDTPELLKEQIMSVKKGSIVSIVGDYYSNTNGFPIGTLMEKGLTLRGGQVHLQRYWKKIYEMIKSGEVDPTPLLTHKFRLEDADKAYRLFDDKEDNSMKVMLRPSHSSA
jgi:threonine dehydrogenase-like Zn-dependent dehydrogenase